MKSHASMNRIYRLVWNHTLGVMVAVAENAKGRGKSSTSRGLVAGAVALTGGLFLTPFAQAGPTGGQVSAGSGTIAQVGLNTTINQSSQNLAINWQGFSIAANEAVRFNQPSASSIALNRVIGQNPSQILGSLSANGQVFVVNPNGVLFGATAQVNVGGLVASTLGLSDADLMAGKYTFNSGAGTSGTVVNQGSLTAAQGGYIALLAPEVRNEGVIVANRGTALLAAGDKVTLNMNNGSLLGYNIDQGALNALADNKQLIQADGGQVFMGAKAADALTTAVVNNTGILQARTVQNVGGVIKLMGDMETGTVNVGGTLDASAPAGGNGGFIETSAAHVKVTNGAKVTTAAAAGLSGTWLIDPTDFTIAATGGDIDGATLSANLGSNAIVTIQSSNGASGTAGNVNVNDAVSWSANKLTLNAQNNININANLNASASASLALEFGQGAVAAGNTSNIITGVNGKVNLPASTSNFTTLQGSDGVLKNYTVITALGAAGSVTDTDLQGMSGGLGLNYALGGDIDAAATIGWNALAGFAPVTSLQGTFDGLGHTIAGLTINRNANMVGLFGSVMAGSVIRNVGLTNVSVSGGSGGDVGGLVGHSYGTTISNSYASGSVSGRTSVGGLVGYGKGTISNSYSSSIVSGTFANIGGLVGTNTGTISNSYATGSVSNSGTSAVGGLAGVNWTGATVSNSYATGNVSGIRSVGGLLGNDGGTVSNSYATGTVSGSSYVGGLVGFGGSSISNSYATGSVTGTTHVGGLLGAGYGGTISISNSYATGLVTGTTNVGGLVGYTYGGTISISNSYATGTVSGSDQVGGLVGYAYGAGTYGGRISISNSYATGTVSGSNQVGGLVGYAYGTGTYGGMISISNSYATGLVTGTTNVGGLVGFNDGGTVSNSFWNTETSGTTSSAGGIGMTTAGMQTLANFNSATAANGDVNPNWDMAGTWIVYDGHTAPLLRSFMTALTVTANDASKTYDGQTYTASGLTYSTTPNANLLGALDYNGATNAGTYAASGLYSNQQGYIVSYVGGALTINKAHLTVTANDASRLYGAANPTLTATVSGFITGENAATAAGFTGAGSATTTAVATTNVGSAVITAGAGSLAATNYDFTTLVDGTLTIAAVPNIATPITATPNIATPITANGIPPVVAAAIAALPGGSNGNLVDAYKAAIAESSQGVVAASNTSSQPGRREQRDNFLVRMDNATPQSTTVVVRNGGIKLPADLVSQE